MKKILIWIICLLLGLITAIALNGGFLISFVTGAFFAIIAAYLEYKLLN